MLSVIYGKSVFSSVLASVDSREMCLYELSGTDVVVLVWFWDRYDVG